MVQFSQDDSDGIESGSPVAREAILAAVENQIRDNEPPQTRQTVKRLTDEGCSAKEARRLVATALVVEIFHALKDGEAFNRKRYLHNLLRLPAKPLDKDEP